MCAGESQGGARASGQQVSSPDSNHPKHSHPGPGKPHTPFLPQSCSAALTRGVTRLRGGGRKLYPAKTGQGQE